MWQRRRHTGVNCELPGHGKEGLIQACTVVRVGEVRVSILAEGPTTSTFHVIALSQGGIGLWKGCVGKHGVGAGVNLSIEYVFRNQGKAQSLEELF